MHRTTRHSELEIQLALTGFDTYILVNMQRAGQDGPVLLSKMDK